MNSYDYARTLNQSLAYDSYVTNSYIPAWSDEALQKYKDHSDPIFYPDTDWFDLMLKPAAYNWQNNLSISGGTESVKYFVSLGYLSQNGHLNTDLNDPGYDPQIKYKRYNLRSNFDFNITKRLSLLLDLSTQIGVQHGTTWSTTRWFEMLSATPPNTSPGMMFNHIIVIPTITTITPDPLYAFQQGYDEQYANNLNGSIRLNYDLGFITKGLKARGAISYRNYNTQARSFSKSAVSWEARRLEDGALSTFHRVMNRYFHSEKV